MRGAQVFTGRNALGAIQLTASGKRRARYITGSNSIRESQLMASGIRCFWPVPLDTTYELLINSSYLGARNAQILYL